MPDVYRIGVQIAMASNGAAVLGALGREMLGLGIRAKDLEGGLNRVKLVAAGLGGVLAGSAVIGGLVKLVEHGKEFVHQQSLMAQAGVAQIDIANATATAWQTAGSVIGTSAEKNIELVADLRNRLGSMKEAIQALPDISRVGVVLQNLTGQDQAKTGDTLAKFLEQRGALVDPKTHEISAARLEQQARLAEAIALGTRGKVGPEQLLMFQQYARAAGASLSDQGLINIAPIVGASSRPSTVGTQLSSLQQQLIGGITTQAGAHFLEQLGVLDRRRVHEGRGGHLTFDRDALVDTKSLASDPVSYINKYIRGGLMRMGDVTADAQTTELLRSHLRATVIGLLTEVVRSFPAFQKDAANIRQAATVDPYAVAQNTDPTTKLANFQTAWKNLLTALGAPLVNDATGMLGGLTNVLTRLTVFAGSHPRLVENLELVAGGLATLVAVSGSAAIAGAALGPLAAGITALRGAVIGQAALGPGLATAATGLGLLSKAVGVFGAALGGYALGTWLHDNTPAGKVIDETIDRLNSAARDGPETRGIYKWLQDHIAGVPVEGVTPEEHAGQVAARKAAQKRALASVPTLPGAPRYDYQVMPEVPVPGLRSGGGSGYTPNAPDLFQRQAYRTGGTDPVHMQPIALQISLDGRVIADSVTHHQTQAMSRPSPYGNSPDQLEVAPRPGMPLVAF